MGERARELTFTRTFTRIVVDSNGSRATLYKLGNSCALWYQTRKNTPGRVQGAERRSSSCTQTALRSVVAQAFCSSETSDPPSSAPARDGRFGGAHQRFSGGMSTTPLRKAVAAAPHGDTSLPALLSRLRDLRKRVAGDLSVEDVESALKRIEAAKLSKAKAGREIKNLRDRVIYALTEAEDADMMASGGGRSSGGKRTAKPPSSRGRKRWTGLR